MQLLTKALLKRFEQVGDQDVPDPVVVAKFFGGSAYTFFVTAYYPAERLFFGYATFQDGNGELGYTSQDELEAVRFPPFRLPVERDLYWTEKPLSKAKAEIGE